MYRNKKDVDKYVENLQSKLSNKEFKTRAFSVARLYFDIGDYINCQKYVEQYLTQKDNNAAAYKLLGQALHKLGHKDKALDHYKTSLDIDPTQSSTILDICELLADNDLDIEPGRSKYWCEKAEATFPTHPITFRLRERLVTLSSSDPEALVKLLTAEIAARPKDPTLHARLLKHYLSINKLQEAFEYACNVEFSSDNFINNYIWYETLNGLLEHKIDNANNWLHQLLLLTVLERICVLSLTEIPSGSSKSLPESNTLLHSYDQALQSVAKSGAPSGFAEFHASLLSHHRGQFAFNAATFILKKAKKNQISWREAAKVAAPLMLIAWQTSPLDSKVNWLKHAPEKLLAAVARWYTEGAYRCSQSGHYLISNFQDKNQTFLDQIAQYCSGTHWKDKLYETIFSNRNLLAKIKSSHFVSNAFNAPVLRLPRKIEVEAYDGDAQKQYGNSLHHFVWTLLNYKNYAHFKCTLFDLLTPIVTSYGPETLNKLDIHAFLYCAALTTKQQKAKEVSYVPSEKPNIFPANITDLLCPLPQMKWWDCAYKFSQNLLGTELTDIRATLSRGIEVVRCVDNHGLDVELLCMLGRIFSERAKITTSVEDKNFLELRACMYYGSAIPLLEKLKCRIMIKVSDKRMFDYTHRELETRELNALLEESKLYVAVNYINDSDYDKAIEVLLNVKSVQAFYHLAQTYKKIAEEKINSSTADSKSKYTALLVKSKNYAYKALDMLKETEMNKNSSLYIDIQELIEDLEVKITKIEHDISVNMNDAEGKYSSDENISYQSEPMRSNNNIYRNISSTPKAPSNPNMTSYRSAIDSQILEMTRVDQQHLERIEYEIKNLQKRDTTISDFMIQTKDWFDENRKLGNQIISTIHSNIQNTTDQFKLLKISVDQVKDQLDECRNECKDVGDLKKQIAELKKEVNKLKKSTSEQAINESELYNLENEFRSNENASSYMASQIPFPPQMLSQFNQRTPFPVPPNLYQYYNQSLYNLYNQYSQFPQPSSVPGAPPLFDSSRAPVNYSGVYPTPDQMFLDVAHLMPPVVPANPPNPPNIPTIPVVPTMSAMTSVPTSITSSTIATKLPNFTESKEISRSLPVNVVITSSDPLPTTSLTPAPVLSVTIPPKHIKGIPHNYQIAMPPASESDGVSPPVFSFSMPENKSQSTSIFSWKQAFQSFPTDASPLQKALLGESVIDSSKSVVDGPGAEVSPNVSFNKSRTLSEKSNTSVDYDPCPDFKPIVPLPAEVKVTTGEEDEVALFSSRAKLFRFVDKQWKERGIGEMKLLKHKVTGKVRVLMRREQVHKICANHLITSDMEIKPMKNETKAYFWVANDFSEETLVLEKLCIRFKTADIAKDFYDAFEKSRIESKTTTMVVNTASTENSLREKSINQQFIENENTTLGKETNPAISSQNKTTIGGFTFSSTPVFKPVENNTSANQSATDTNTKTNVFSGLTFKSKANLPFSGLLNTPSELTTPVVTKEKQDTKLNTSDNIEEFEPNVEFKPVIPLPALVDQKTGEEDEKVLFEHRAKLLRFDSNTKEWKERGIGNIKLLVHKDHNQKIRLLMRREQIMKVCCNHILTKELVFQKMTNMDKAVTWCAKDFSEGELVTETFCLRFKTVQACDDFIEAIKSAQNRLKDDANAAKEEQNAAKQISNSGFGDKFKPKLGAWNCESCYTNNLENFPKCACCDQPKPNSTKTEITPANKLTTSSSWGDKFKPKSGSWECQSCFVMNEANVEKCNACNSFKDPTLKSNTKNVDFGTPKFEFGIPSQTMTTISNQSKTDYVVKSTPSVGIFNQAKTVDEKSNASFGIDYGFGDKFKPKDGSWECKQCFVSNDSNAESCVACNSLKDPNAPKKSSVIETPSTSMKFRFGIAPTPANDEKPKTATASIFDGTGAHKFSFGVPSSTTSIIEQKPTGVIFAAPKAPSESETPINFSLKKSEEPLKSQTVVKPALLPTPKTDASTFASKVSGKCGFGFDPITFIKSPIKAHNKSQDDESDGEQYVKEEDCQAHFKPVIPIPDKVEVVTGEENETELYAHRARLYRFVAGEWKERGIGIVKILKHKETNKLRVVMRREQVFKICLNHALTPEIMYKPKDDKSWLFAANDFSEGELSVQQLVLRFQNKEIALQFKEAVDSALENKCSSKVQSDTNEKKDEDVVFVSEMQASAEDKKKAKELMLPDNFYNYKNKDPCRGCRGCKESDEIKQETTSTPAIKSLLLAPTITSTPSSVSSSDCTPTKSISSSFQSPVTSVYGTPGANMEKTFDTSIFRTPLSVNTKSLAPNTNNNDSNNIDATNKENIFMQKPNIFSKFSDQKFTTMSTSSPTLFGSGDSQTRATSSLIAPPKLTSFNIAVGNENTDAKSLFASAAANPVFGGSALKDTSIFGNTGSSTNKSVMCFSAEKTKDESNVKSLFGGIDQKPLNIFSGAAQGSLFGPGSLNNQGITTSGSFTFDSSSTQQNNIFTSIFSNNANNQSSFWKTAPTTEQKPEVSIFGVTSENKGKIEETKADKVPETKEAPFKVDNSLTFAALTSSKAGFEVQKKADFKWEGEGEQLFSQNTSSKNDKSNTERANESGTGDEEYDPHYEPIMPLPEKIVVTTGEEDEEKLFGERCKLFRFNDDTHEWKERGVGEMKILYHPERKTYRLLLRREQVHKAVLNMLLFMEFELRPIKNSETAWMWVGSNFAETPAGEHEKLSARFKNAALAQAFHDTVVQCTRKLQSLAAQAIREEKEAKEQALSVPPLRLPKHLADSARADTMLATIAIQQTLQAQETPSVVPVSKSNGDTEPEPSRGTTTESKQVTFRELQPEYQVEEEEEEEEDVDYDHDGYDPHDYEGYYNEEDGENVYYSCEGSAVVQQGDDQNSSEHAHIQVLFDPEIYSPKILVTDADTGEILADMLIHTDTEFQINGDTCSWSGTDYTTNEPLDKMVTVNFYDGDTAAQFLDSCETSKASTYSSQDPES